MKIKIVGAGFSGLTLAYEIRQQEKLNRSMSMDVSHSALEITVVDQNSLPGGLIQTLETPWGMVETAANGMMWNAHIARLCKELQLKPLFTKKESRKRYIFRGSPKQWPLGFFFTIQFVLRMIINIMFRRKTLRPKAQETIADFGKRLTGGSTELVDYLLGPALQGIYAGDTEQMSATSIFASIFRQTQASIDNEAILESAQNKDDQDRSNSDRSYVNKSNLRHKGTFCFQHGMGELTTALHSKLVEDGTTFEFGKKYDGFQLQEDVNSGYKIILCLPPFAAAEILKSYDTERSRQLSQIQMLPLVSTTVFFEQPQRDIQGFGILFPAKENFNVLGVLIPSSIFPFRDRYYSETWILGGARFPEIHSQADSEIQDIILMERARVFRNHQVKPLHFKISRWPKALPHYNLYHESFLATFRQKPPVYLHGNYLGKLGLSKIYLNSIHLAGEIIRNLKGK